MLKLWTAPVVWRGLLGSPSSDDSIIFYLVGGGWGGQRGLACTPMGGGFNAPAPKKTRGRCRLLGSLAPSYWRGRASDALWRQYCVAGSDRTRLTVRRPIQYRP